MINIIPNASPCDAPEVPEELRSLADALICVEQAHHERGWDSTPVTLYMITEPEEGEENLTLTPARLGLVAHPREEIVRAAASMQVLAEIAESSYELGEERMQQMRDVYGDVPLGHAIVMESWVCIPGETTDDLEACQKHAPGDIPGSLEARFAYLASEGQVMVVARLRGQEPEFGCYQPGGDVTFGGEMFDGLILYDGMARKLSRALKEAA